MKRASTTLNGNERTSAKAKALAVRSLASVQKQIILDFINVEGHGVCLNMKGLRRLADRLGMSVSQLKRVLDALARNDNIQLEVWNGMPIALPAWYPPEGHELRHYYSLKTGATV